jgi:hypothetical protein
VLKNLEKDLHVSTQTSKSRSDLLFDVSHVTQAAQAVLDARAAHPGATLADLYDPRMMPPDLVKAHAALDAFIDKAYGLKPTCTDAERVAHLFKLYADRIVCY